MEPNFWWFATTTAGGLFATLIVYFAQQGKKPIKTEESITTTTTTYTPTPCLLHDGLKESMESIKQQLETQRSYTDTCISELEDRMVHDVDQIWMDIKSGRSETLGRIDKIGESVDRKIADLGKRIDASMETIQIAIKAALKRD